MALVGIVIQVIKHALNQPKPFLTLIGVECRALKTLHIGHQIALSKCLSATKLQNAIQHWPVPYCFAECCSSVAVIQVTTAEE